MYKKKIDLRRGVFYGPTPKPKPKPYLLDPRLTHRSKSEAVVFSGTSEPEEGEEEARRRRERERERERRFIDNQEVIEGR